jgi:Rab GDP dissociation inhibitor
MLLVVLLGMDLRRTTTRQFFSHFDLDSNSIDFAGHAMALQADESYLDRPAIETVEALKLYAHSLERYGRSPFLYPEYGLGGLPEAFSRCVRPDICWLIHVSTWSYACPR